MKGLQIIFLVLVALVVLSMILAVLPGRA